MLNQLNENCSTSVANYYLSPMNANFNEVRIILEAHFYDYGVIWDSASGNISSRYGIDGDVVIRMLEQADVITSLW